MIDFDHDKSADYMNSRPPLYVTAGFDEGGECLAVVMHYGTKEATRRARSRIRTKAQNDFSGKVAEFETIPAQNWLGPADVVECVDIGQ